MDNRSLKMNIYTSKSGAILREYVRNIDLKSSRVAIFPEHGREVCSTIELEGRCFKRLEIKSVSIPKNVAGVVGFEPTK